MRQVAARPPNYEAILAVLPMASGPDVIFAYAPDVYVPSGRPLPPELVAHEKVHIARQEKIDGGVETWWTLYLAHAPFRWEEEVLAHRAELKSMLKQGMSLTRSITHVAGKLASPLYGSGATPAAARRALLA